MEAFISGTVARAGTLKVSPSGTPSLIGVAVKVDRKYGQTIKTTYVQCSLYGKAAEFYAQKLIPRCNVLLDGTIEIEKSQDNVPYPTLNIRSVQILPMAIESSIKVVGCGNVTRDAEAKSIKNGERFVLNTAIAVNRKVGSEEKVSFFEIAYFTNTRADGSNGAVNVAPYIGPKASIEVVGVLDVEKCEGQNGERTKVVITCDHIHIVKGKGDNKSENGTGASQAYSKPAPMHMPEPQYPEIDINEDDIPF